MHGQLQIKMDEEIKRKNILDLHFQKYLILVSTSAILIFTYLIGVGIAIITKQIKLNDLIVMAILFIFSVAFIGGFSIIFLKSIYHLKNIPNILKDL